MDFLVDTAITQKLNLGNATYDGRLALYVRGHATN